MGKDKGAARRSASDKLNVERAGKKAKKINQAILGPVGEKAAMAALDAAKGAIKGLSSARKAEQEVRKTVNKRVRTNPSKNFSDAANVAGKVARTAGKAGSEAAQFGGKAAKSVIDDVQGRAKMFLKGFGN